ncbi:HAD-IA family hydrolase [Microbacterium sp. Leaf159]|uniref:HAD-IA family hydrolase n=1 Tax=Microbacterium sp. Leaf159 TaxID=1736279 RepID=UPI0009E6EB75|nr:HAD-IA family hydrolase [Microbacterium sp. Leaf159]
MMSAHHLSFTAVLFDMDGTLVDSLSAAEATWTRLAAYADAPPRDVIDYSHGRQIVDSVARFLSDLSPAEQVTITRRLLEQEIEEASSAVEVPGAASLMTALLDHKVPVAVVTSATRDLAIARMTHAGVPIPGVLVSAEDVSHGKPAPDPYLHAASLLGTPPDDCLVFEDAEAGIRSGLASGAQVVVRGIHESSTTADLVRIVDYEGAELAFADGRAQLAFPASTPPSVYSQPNPREGPQS